MSNTTHLFKSFPNQSQITSLRKKSKLVAGASREVQLQIKERFFEPLKLALTSNSITATSGELPEFSDLIIFKHTEEWFKVFLLWDGKEVSEFLLKTKSNVVPFDSGCMWLRDGQVVWQGEVAGPVHRDPEVVVQALENAMITSLKTSIIDKSSNLLSVLKSLNSEYFCADPDESRATLLSQVLDLPDQERPIERIAKYHLFYGVYWKMKNIVMSAIDYHIDVLGRETNPVLENVRLAGIAWFELFFDDSATAADAAHLLSTYAEVFNIFEPTYNSEGPDVPPELSAVLSDPEATDAVFAGIGVDPRKFTEADYQQIMDSRQEFDEFLTTVKEILLREVDSKFMELDLRGKMLWNYGVRKTGIRLKGFHLDFSYSEEQDTTTVRCWSYQVQDSLREAELQGHISVNMKSADPYHDFGQNFECREDGVQGHLTQRLALEDSAEEAEEAGDCCLRPVRYTVYPQVTSANIEKVHQAGGNCLAALQPICSFDTLEYSRRRVASHVFLASDANRHYVFYNRGPEADLDAERFVLPKEDRLLFIKLQQGEEVQRETLMPVLFPNALMETVTDVKFCSLLRLGDCLLLQHLFELDAQTFRRISLLSKVAPRLLSEWTADHHLRDVNFLPHRPTTFILSISSDTLEYQILMVRHNKILEVNKKHQLQPAIPTAAISSYEVDPRKMVFRVLMSSSTYEDKIPKVWIVDMKVKL